MWIQVAPLLFDDRSTSQTTISVAPGRTVNETMTLYLTAPTIYKVAGEGGVPTGTPNVDSNSAWVERTFTMGELIYVRNFWDGPRWALLYRKEDQYLSKLMCRVNTERSGGPFENQAVSVRAGLPHRPWR